MVVYVTVQMQIDMDTPDVLDPTPGTPEESAMLSAVQEAVAEAVQFVVLPDGHTVTLQYRREGPSLGILFDKPQEVHCWNNECIGMDPAPSVNRRLHVRLADQLMIPLVLEGR
jgi:hypothetical protein